MLVEHVRGVLSRYISNRFSANGQIRTLVMSHDMESLVRGGIRQTSAGAFINLTPPETGSIIQSLESCIRSNGVNARDIILMVSLDIRRFVKKIIEGSYPEMEVLSYGDVASGVDVDVIGTLEK
jgi:type III secretion protein V